MFTKIFSGFTALAALVLFAGCQAPQKKPLSGAPAWVLKGGAAFSKQENERYFFTVGSAEISSSVPSAREDAHFQAKTEMAGQVKSYVARFMKTYSERYADHFKKANSIDEKITQSMAKDVAEATLSNFDFVDHYVDSHGKSENTMYALLRMPRKSFDKALVHSAKQRAAMLLSIKADEFEKKMEDELKKNHEREAGTLKNQ